MGLTEKSFLERMELMGLYPTKTNADIMRSLSDKELADFLDGIDQMKDVKPCSSAEWLEWLQREVE